MKQFYATSSSSVSTQFPANSLTEFCRRLLINHTDKRALIRHSVQEPVDLHKQTNAV